MPRSSTGTETNADKGGRPRRGRPPAHAAGTAEGRVLEGATALFLEQGFGRTTLEQVATRARVGKSSVYGRFIDKPTLFAAVVQRSIAAMFAELEATPGEGTTREQLRHLGMALAKSLLVPRCVALMRITAAEAETMPELARSAYAVSFEASVRAVRAVLDADPALADQDLDLAARRFVEVALQPISFQAAFGGDVERLRARCASDAADAVLLLEAMGLLPG